MVPEITVNGVRAMCVFATLLIVRTTLAQPADAGVMLAGVVATTEGAPVAGATVRIYSAGPKRGLGIL